MVTVIIYHNSWRTMYTIFDGPILKEFSYKRAYHADNKYQVVGFLSLWVSNTEKKWKLGTAIMMLSRQSLTSTFIFGLIMMFHAFSFLQMFDLSKLEALIVELISCWNHYDPYATVWLYDMNVHEPTTRNI
jgi:hypothetical protein